MVKRTQQCRILDLVLSKARKMGINFNRGKGGK